MRGIGRFKSIAGKVRNRLIPGALILLYHRVAELTSDPQLLAVTPQHFAEHLQVIRNLGGPIRLQDLASGLKDNKVRRHGLVVTFDDGAADNLVNAKPILERHDVPATVFVATGYTGSDVEFWWDELERLFLLPGQLPATLRLKVNEGILDLQLEGSSDYSETDFKRHQNWNVLEPADPTTRHKAYRKLHELLRPMTNTERSNSLVELREWSGQGITGRPTHRALTHSEIQQLADGGLVEIGAHTVSHPVLSAITLETQEEEILRSRIELQEIVGQPIMSFAYPYGTLEDYTSETVDLVRSMDFQCACSNFRGVVQPRTEIFELPRIVVRDWDGDEFERRVRKWFRE